MAIEKCTYMHALYILETLSKLVEKWAIKHEWRRWTWTNRVGNRVVKIPHGSEEKRAEEGWHKLQSAVEGREEVPCGVSNGWNSWVSYRGSNLRNRRPREGEQHPTSLGEEMPLEEECNFLPRPRRKPLPLPFVAPYFAECPVRVTDKGLCERGRNEKCSRKFSNNEDGWRRVGFNIESLDMIEKGNARVEIRVYAIFSNNIFRRIEKIYIRVCIGYFTPCVFFPSHKCKHFVWIR